VVQNPEGKNVIERDMRKKCFLLWGGGGLDQRLLQLLLMLGVKGVSLCGTPGRLCWGIVTWCSVGYKEMGGG